MVHTMSTDTQGWQWANNECIVLDNGMRVGLFSEQVRGERRWYWAQYQRADETRWHLTGDEGSHDKRTVKRRMERYAQHEAEQERQALDDDARVLLNAHADALAELIEAQSELTRIENELDELGIPIPAHNA